MGTTGRVSGFNPPCRRQAQAFQDLRDWAVITDVLEFDLKGFEVSGVGSVFLRLMYVLTLLYFESTL